MQKLCHSIIHKFYGKKTDETYIDGQYSRGHDWNSAGGLSVTASSSPLVVPLPY
jgi:hypothetical protein